ncbi:MAG: hypothetical protein KDD89_03575 [Anaerolineales bacterium]|nr:hypothetical protein [Anaerolineales bacterium]
MKKAKALMFGLWIAYFPLVMLAEKSLINYDRATVLVMVVSVFVMCQSFSLFGASQALSLRDELNKPVIFGTPNYSIVEASRRVSQRFVGLYWIAILATVTMMSWFNYLAFSSIGY